MGFSRQEYWSGVPSPSPFQWLELAICFLFKENTFNVHDDLSESSLVLQALCLCVGVGVGVWVGVGVAARSFHFCMRAFSCCREQGPTL